MKKVFFIPFFLFLVFFLAMSCSSNENGIFMLNESEHLEHLSTREKEKINDFESRYVCCNNNKTRSAADGIVLIGYKTVSYQGEDSVFVNKLWEYYKKEIEATGYTVTLDGKVRIYFRMKDAIIFVNGKKYTADSTGVIHNVNINENSTLEAIGCEKSNKSIKTIFARKYKHEKLYLGHSSVVFNLGERKTCCAKKKSLKRTLRDSEGSDSGESNVPCTTNHPGYPNCSKAFNITTERCEFKDDRCMDYNGYGTDCSGSHLYFVGSDCSKAMALFHCWNELM